MRPRPKKKFLFRISARRTVPVSASYKGTCEIYILADAQKHGMQINCRMNRNPSTNRYCVLVM